MAMIEFLKMFLRSPQKSAAETGDGDIFSSVMGKKFHINNPYEGTSINAEGENTKQCL